MAQPRAVTLAHAEDFLESISSGVPMTVWSQRPGNPGLSTIKRWFDENEINKRRYQAAREMGFDAIADRTRATARGLPDTHGGESTGDWQRDRLIIDTDLKLLAKWAPKKYGDRVEVEHSGVVGDLGELSSRVNSLLGKALDSFAAGGPLPPPTAAEQLLPTVSLEEDPW